MDKRKSFTIVELIIVAGVISILVGVLLVALVPARKKAKDITIISDLAQIQNRAELLFLNNGKYPGVCCETGCDPKIISLCNDINAQGGSVTLLRQSYGQRNYCAYANLSTQSGGTPEVFCVDYTGFADKLTSTMCNSSNFSAYVCLDCYDFVESGVIDADDVKYVYDCNPWKCNDPSTKPGGCDPQNWGCERLDLTKNGVVNSSDSNQVLAYVGMRCQIRR